MNGLPWVRFDTTLPDNPKVLELLTMKDGYRAAFVYCCGLAYSGRHGTDGHIPGPALGRIHGRRCDAEKLVKVGLWDPAESGWWVQSWAEYQQLAETSERIREERRKAGRKGNCVRHHGPDCGCWQEEPGPNWRPRALP